MNYEQFKKNAQKHLAKWIRDLYPDIEIGVYNSNNGTVEHDHIIPVPHYKEGKRKDAIVDAITKYNVLTDGIVFNLVEFPKKELHTLANHLTSSQMLCYNFFRLLLKEESSHNREIKITQDLVEWLHTSFPNLPKVTNSAKCVFEYKFDDEEETSFDFCIMDEQITLLFEIKYTEDGFGKAKNDDKHQNKFRTVYRSLINNQDTVYTNIPETVFFKNYQLFRNAIRTNGNIYFVAIFPYNNKKCKKEFEYFRNNYVQHSERIVSIDWEEAFLNSPITANSELRNKYMF